MSKKHISALVVVYNKRCEDSYTCKALKHINGDNIEVIIYDNSTKDMHNYDYCKECGWVYLGGDGNKGISKAYNACIDYLKQKEKSGLLCLFDDDTKLQPEYFDLLQSSFDEDKKMYVPLILANDKLISPCILKKGHKVICFDDAQQALDYSGDELSAINSCTAIDLSVFDDYRYDENIFLDGVDHVFYVDMRKKGIKPYVFDYRCHHSFSGVEMPKLKSAVTRFKIYKKDYKYIFRNEKFYYFKLVGKRALSLCLKYKTLKCLFLG